MIRVGLIGAPQRPEIRRLAVRLEERGAEPVVLDGREDPRITVEPGRVSACGVDLTALRAVYVCDLGLPGVPATATAEARGRALARSRRQLAAWNALLGVLARTMPVVNPPETHDLHGVKPYELGTYAGEGLPVPWTVSTTDPAELTALAARDHAWIAKGMVGGLGYTEAFVPPQDADEARTRLVPRPLSVQERVEGDNYRAFVLGGRVIGAAAMISTNGAETDSRRGGIRVHRALLPKAAEATALRASALWGMPFAAVDFMKDERTGCYVVLECNSSPFFVNFEIATGHDISGALAEYLVRGHRA